MIPQEFLSRMKSILGEQYENFERALEMNAERGFRINTLKCAPEDFDPSLLPDSEALDYVEGGFVFNSDATGIGNTPSHHSGRIYVQDPGAMATAEAAEVSGGMWIADLCAAPGGKSTQLAAKLEGEGFILANEFVPKRAKILVSNFERMGIRNGMVTSLDTGALSALFRAAFDIVVADAPCSGEGMLRKDVPAAEEWSVENVAACKKRQLEILDNASSMVKSGGVLIYSTCTYSLEENEEVVDEFLRKHNDYSLVAAPAPIARVSCDGITFPGSSSDKLSLCRRFYPHVSRGEGQFIAVLRRGEAEDAKILFKDSSVRLTQQEKAAVEAFFSENLTEAPSGRIVKHGDNIVLLSHGCPIPPKSVFSAGVLIGELRGRVLVPSHQFFSAYGTLFKRKRVLRDEREAALYIAGEELDSDFESGGFCSVLYRTSSLGGGKAVGSKIKNHYPKGLRKPL